MAKETMEWIRQAETKADQIVKDARSQADEILSEAKIEAGQRIQNARMEAAAMLHQTETAANDKAAAETKKSQEETEREVEALRALAVNKEADAIKLVLDSIV
jgi:vacuolar-type H+-ATPase subunit H